MLQFIVRVFIVLLFIGTVQRSKAQKELDQELEQEFLNELYLPENGLPVTTVNQILQTPNGFIWMATFNGLVRFDGLTYQHYTVSNTEDLRSNRLVSIQPGQGNSFWLTTEQGHLIQYRHQKFHTYGVFPDAEHQRIYLDGDSVTWVIAEYGLARADEKQLEFVESSELNHRNVKAFHRQGDGAILLGLASGEFYKSRYPYRFFQRITTLPSDRPRKLFGSTDGTLWHYNNTLGSIAEGRFVNPKNLKEVFANWTGTPPLFYALEETPNGELLLLRSETGLFLLKNQEIYPIELDQTPEIPSEPERLGASMCRCDNGDVWSYVDQKAFRNGVFQFQTREKPTSIYCDRENSIWFSLYREGVQRFRHSPINVYTSDSGNNNFYGVYEDSFGNVWMGEWFKNLYVLANDSLHAFEVSPISGTTASFLESSDGRFFIGNRYTENNGPNPPESLDHFIRIPEIDDDVHTIFQASDQTIWFGTKKDLYRLKGHQVDVISLPDENHLVRYLLENRNRDIWMATNGGGVYRYEIKTEAWKKFSTADGLTSNNIRALLEDRHGMIWIATEDAGLNRLDPNSGEIESIDVSGGLYNNSLHSLRLDAANRLWMSSNAGIFFIPFEQLNALLNGSIHRVESTVFTERNGMKNREANGGFQNSSITDSKGNLWYPTQQGVVSIDPDQTQQENRTLSLEITEIRTGDTTLPLSKDSYELNSAQTNLRLCFVAPTFITPKQLKYRYRLKGFEREWQQANESREAVYTNLPAGEYRFEVETFNQLESNPMGYASLAIAKKPTLLESVWFKVLMGLCFLCSVVLVYRWRSRQHEVRQMELEAEVAMRTRELEIEKALTEKQKEALIRLDREKNNFFTNISHEFRTPLTLILGPLNEILDRDGSLSDSNRRKLNRAIRNSERLQSLVEQLLDLARLESGKLDLNLKTGDLLLYIKQIADHYKNLADRRNIRFQLDCTEGELPVDFDETQLDKVFHNLLSNAFKFTESGGAVHLSVRRSEDFVDVKLHDTGKGIAPEHLAHLFDRFYQMEKSEVQPGSGIGLSIAKEISELHGAKLQVTSTQGKGTVFTLRFRLSKGRPECPPQRLETTAVKDEVEGDSRDKNAGRKHILVVDDHAEIRSYIGEALQKSGAVSFASSGKEALKKMENHLPDLVVSDIMMPNGDGFFLLESIRKNKEWNHLPVILLTAKAQVKDKLRGLGIGADDYITKPFYTNELKARVATIFDRQLRLQRHFLTAKNPKSFRLAAAEMENADEAQLNDLKSYLEKRISDPSLTVDEIAAHLSVSRSSLYRKLTKLLGETPKELLLRLRMERALLCLQNKMGNVSEVAYSCGFSSLAHFSKTFKQYYGKSPGQFAELGSKKEANSA